MNVAHVNASADVRDSANMSWLRALALAKPIAASKNRVLPVVVDELAERFGERPALLGDDESFTFHDLADRSNRYARWALEQGVAAGGLVCLLMPNRPEYMMIWLGITRVGGVVALLNTNLVGTSLAHCIDIAGADHIIVARELMDAFAAARQHLTTEPKIWLHGREAGLGPSIGPVIAGLSGARLSNQECPSPSIFDRALLIYTSGTTGLPKAANVSHHRVLTWTFWFAGMMNIHSGDRMYDCLPMYHSVGGIVATGALLVNGGSVVIRDNFSASRFWDDIVRWECTVFQYIGELCRYLLLATPNPRERAHRIRLCCGNGLREDVWNAFQKRFQIPQILEFYAATEGNVTLFNCEGKPGAIGRIPSFLAHRSATALVRHDIETGDVVRDRSGHCLRCLAGEVGEAVGKISDSRSDLSACFDGYTNSRDSENKILRNVFVRGDAWFRTGDLMRKDENGFFYFVDRIGDSFRWKGENVSTAEVEQAIATYPGAREASVYGVRVPGTDGRAGMAAVVVDGSFDLSELHRHLAARLPAYACPLFLRLVRAIQVTGTFKQKKQDLMRAGYDPNALEDAIFFNDATLNAFVQLDRELFEQIQAGKVRL